MIISRYYHLSCINFNLKKQGLKLCNMVNPKNSKRHWHPTQSIEANLMPSVKSLTKVKYEPNKRGVRRIAMLNKMFMKQITDLMSTGTVALDIVGRGIEISKVSVTPDLNRVNVFWVCKGNSSDVETESVLNKTAGALRHELSTLRIMGEIPYIIFVKDKQETHLVDLDQRLAVADYGEDYTPTELGHLLKSEFSLNTKLSPEVKAKIKNLEDDLPLVEDPIPEMTHNVYGLDHLKIMSRLLAARKKTSDAWATLNKDSDVISYRVSPDFKVPDRTNQKQELADFLLKRQIMQKKLHKQLTDSRQYQLLPEEDMESEEYDDVEEDQYEGEDEESYTDYADREYPHIHDNTTKL